MSGVGRYPDRARLGWWGLALALFGALWIAVSSVAGAVCLGVAAYYAARPIHRSFRHRVRFEGLAALCSLSVLALPISAALAALAGITAREVALAAWLTRRYEGVERFGRQFAATLDTPTQLFSTREIDALGNAAETGLTFTGIVGTVAIHLFVACAIAFYLLRDDRRFVRWVSYRFGSGAGDRGRTGRSLASTDTNHSTYTNHTTGQNKSIPLDDSVSGGRETAGTTTPIADGAGAGTTTRSAGRRLLVEYCRRVDRDLEGVFFGAAAGALVTAAVGVLAYGLLGSLAPPELAAPYLQLGLAVGVGGLVPAVGRKVVYLSAAVVLTSIALAGSLGTLWFVAACLVASLLVVERASDRVLRTYGVDPRRYGGLMALACVLGVLQVGWYGVLVGPIVLVSLVQFGRVVVPTLLGSVRPTSTDPVTLAPPATMASKPPRAESADTTTPDSGDPRRRARYDWNRGRGQHRPQRASERATTSDDGQSRDRRGEGWRRANEHDDPRATSAADDD